MIPLAVFGDPIAHSLSPQLHQLFAQQVAIEINYRAILAPPATFAQQLQSFFNDGGVGANITLPHKVTVMSLADEISQRAALAGAANTLSQINGQLHADNTDGAGLVRDLKRQLGALQGARVLILGAGGAVRGIVGPLLDAGCQTIVLRNRTAEKAQRIADRMNQQETGQAVRLYQADDDRRAFDLIINAVSAGHQQQSAVELSPTWFASSRLIYDLSYGRAAEPFLNQAQALQSGLSVSDGLGMLVAQGAESFTIWTGQEVEFTQALRILRESL